MIDITNNKVKEHLDTLHLIKNLRYLKQIGQFSKIPFFEPKQKVNLDKEENHVEDTIPQMS